MEEASLSYTHRQKSEEIFHDARSVIAEDEHYCIEHFCAVTSPETLFSLKHISPIEGKKILDIGCGCGEAALYFIRSGAFVDAMDISSGALDILRQRAQRFAFTQRLRIIKSPAEHLPQQSEFYDNVYGYGILHHVDIEKTIREVHRVLKPGGKAVFIEPLSYNPAIKVYRWICRDLRSPMEKPVRYEDISGIRRIFSKCEQKEFQLTTILIFLLFFFSGVNPNKVRYWKKIIYDADKYKEMFRLLSCIDSVILRVFPSLKRFCWNVVLVLEK